MKNSVESMEPEIEAYSYHRWELDDLEITFLAADFLENEFSTVGADSETITLSVSASIKIQVNASFSIYYYDRIDQEETCIGTQEKSIEEEFVSDLLIHITNNLDEVKTIKDLEINFVELLEPLSWINVGEVELDYGPD